MYASHWGLRESPFRNCTDPHCFYQSPTHEEALARLHFLVEQHRRLGLLLGPEGSGKSFLLEVFAGQFRRSGRPAAKVNLLAIEPAELLWLVALELGLNPDPGSPTAALWRMVTDRLLENRYQQTRDGDPPGRRRPGQPGGLGAGGAAWRNTTARRRRV